MSQSKKFFHKNLLLGTLFFLPGIDLSGQTCGVGFNKKDTFSGISNRHEITTVGYQISTNKATDTASLFKNLGFGILFGPNFSGRYLKFNEPPEENQIRYEYMQALNSRESSNYNFSLGLFTRLELTRYISVRTGLNFNRVSYKSSQLDSILIATDPSSGPVYTSGVYSFQYDILCLPIEVLINFFPKNKIVRPYLGIGVLNGAATEKFLVNGSVPTKYQEFIQYPTNTKFHSDINCIGGLSFNIKRFVGFAEMNYRQSLTHKSAPYPISKVLFSVNLNMGFGFIL